MMDPRISPRGILSRGSLWYAGELRTAEEQELEPWLVHHAAALVEMGGDLDETTRRAIFGALLSTMIAQRQGSTRIPVTEEISELAGSGGAPRLVGTDEDAYVPLIVTGGWLYHQRTLHYERELGRRLHDRLRREDRAPGDVGSAIAAIVDQPTRLRDGTPIVLSDEQLDAVRIAATRPLSVVTGGPGTGKTSIVVSLLRALVRLGVAPERIALAAPTGKAANRLGESIEVQLRSLEEFAPLIGERQSPQTLHRLLEYSAVQRRFRRDESNPIEADWVIVDEASMIDLVLMERLVRCVAPEAQLVLLGDVEQLPSVETGTVLRDLIPSDDAGHVAWLRTSFRMDPGDPAGRAILSLAAAVRSASNLPASPHFEDVPPEAMRPRLLGLVDEWFADRIAAIADFDRLTRQSYRVVDGEFDEAQIDDIRRLFRHFDHFRILCLTRVYATGADALNTAFHLRMARRAGVEGIPDYVGGEPVLMLRNDYQRHLFNGDQGLILWVDNGEEVRLGAVFADHEGGFRAHHLSGLSGVLTHAWAMTVHKSQGSEFDHVALVLPEEDISLLSRELLYTAITRARRSVRILGPKQLLAAGVARTVERWSGLGKRVFEE